MNFLNYVLLEATDEKVLSHLEHLEDHVINHGEEGYHHAMQNLKDVHHQLSGHHGSDTAVTTKFDGSPSVIFGHHPKTGKFFVATKSAFNKDPKINYSHEDIEKNHGHAPGLVAKLKAAHSHLSKVAPKKGVYQGDIMHTHEDLHDDGHHIHFTPNTITYSIHKDSHHHEKAKNSKIGIVVHTKYEGQPDSDHHIGGMHATFTPDHSSFKQHKDVHLITPHTKLQDSPYTPEQKRSAEDEMAKAESVHKTIHSHEYHAVSSHELPLKTYINSTVRTGETPSVEGYKAHVSEKLKKEVDKVKTAAAKEKRQNDLAQTQHHIESNKESFKKVLQLHHHLQRAKDSMVDAMSAHNEFAHSVNGKATKPEGFVSVRHGRPTKFVNRSEFSRLNFENNRGK